MLRCLSGRYFNSWQAADKQPIAYEAMIFNLNNGAVLHWAAEFILTSRYEIGRALRSLWKCLYPSHSAQFKDLSLEQRKGSREQRWARRKRWLQLKVTYDHELHFPWVICSSFTTCGECCRLTGLITLFSVNVNVWGAAALCCCNMSRNYYVFPSARTHKAGPHYYSN